ncbi:MAG: Fic family protein [Candidatus Hydrogenedentota bacterium]
MIPFSKRQGEALAILATKPDATSPTTAENLGEKLEVSIATIRRDMADLLKGGYVASTGPGRGGGYTLTVLGRLSAPIDPVLHCAVDPDKRFCRPFDPELIRNLPISLFRDDELAKLAPLPPERSMDLRAGDTAARKELERFVIELAWKSSSIEGNTYSLLDTQELLTTGRRAPGRKAEEAIMILNHKTAFQFVLENLDEFRNRPSEAVLRQVHAVMVKGLNVDTGFRRRLVGITSTSYRPADNEFQIKEAVKDILDAVGRTENSHTAALTALAGLSYVQPFVDGNKRTSRLVADAVLLSRNLHPLSYRGVENSEFLSAMLTFYETGSAAGIKQIYSRQFEFSRDHYRLHAPSSERGEVSPKSAPGGASLRKKKGRTQQPGGKSK